MSIYHRYKNNLEIYIYLIYHIYTTQRCENRIEPPYVKTHKRDAKMTGEFEALTRFMAIM